MTAWVEEDQEWNDDSDADWTIDFEDHSSLSGGSVYAPVASDGQASLRRSISEIDLSVSEEEVIQTFACWKMDLVGVTGLCGPVVDELLLANVLVSQKGSECRSCGVAPNTTYFAFIAENCPVSQCHVLK